MATSKKAPSAAKRMKDNGVKSHQVNIFAIAELNQMMGNLIISNEFSNPLEAVDFREKLQGWVDSYNQSHKDIVAKYNIVVSEDGKKVESGDEESANKDLKTLTEVLYEFEPPFTLKELNSALPLGGYNFNQVAALKQYLVRS